MINFDVTYSQRFGRKRWSVVLNCGRPVVLPDGTILGSFESSLCRDIRFDGDKLIVVEIGDTEASPDTIEKIRSQWTSVYDLFNAEQFKDADFYRSKRVELGDFAFSFWYSGENFPGPIHNTHLPGNFYELHTQILGTGEMQKFYENDESTLYERVILRPGQTHKPFFDQRMNYPWHRYLSITPSVLLAVESHLPIPRK